MTTANENTPLPGSYTPMREFEVVLRVHVPVSEPAPAEWDWPELTDQIPDDLTFKSSRLIRTYNRDWD